MASPLIPFERLNEIPLTRGLPHELLALLQPHLSEQSCTAGRVILKPGDYLDGLYYIVEGDVEVRVPPAFGDSRPSRPAPVAGVDRNAGPGERLRLGSDETFGEGGALTRYP